MILDTSALLAILLNEADAAAYATAIAEAADRRISAATWVETAQVITTRRGERGVDAFRALVKKMQAKIEPVDLAQAELAYSALRQFGRGRHPAALNFGDCFSYALAKQRAESLLFKGEDFSRTDIQSAL
ncbi:MAG TPA: type II toxin-antitoxin system VapC family toxin [Burkholderiales bacterium]|nr:type II toxin-antitoxin system VapC family toxin [Burkholderiales bacterium]